MDDTADGPLPNPRRALVVAQYWRGRDISGRPLPLHWALFALWNATPESLALCSRSADHDHWGTCYQVTGNRETLYYSCTNDECMEILADEFRGCLPVGEVHVDDLPEVEQLCKGVHVWRQREDWCSQNWVLGALLKLQRQGWVDENVTPNGIRNELEEMWQYWGKGK